MPFAREREGGKKGEGNRNSSLSEGLEIASCRSGEDDNSSGKINMTAVDNRRPRLAVDRDLERDRDLEVETTFELE
jgi:hypothetical protein